MLFAAEILDGAVATAIVIQIFIGLNGMLNTYLGFLNKRDSAKTIDKVDQNTQVTIQAAKVAAIRGDKSLLDTQVKDQIREIRDATNGQLTKQFELLNERLDKQDKRFDILEQTVHDAMASMSGGVK